MEFSKDIQNLILTLRQIYESNGNKKSFIKVDYPVIEILYSYKIQELSIKLLYDSGDNTFELQEPTYRFYSKISYYDFRRPEARWTRNKKLLFLLIRNLKRSGFWERLSNKDFLIVNKFNKEADPKDRLKVLKEVLTKFPGVKGAK